MHAAIERRIEQQAGRVAQARDYAARLREALGPLTAWVYGSVASGKFKEWSDTDVLVVAEGLPADVHERGRLLYEHVAPGIEPKGFTPSELTGLVAGRSPMLLGMLAQRIVLVDDLDLEGPLAQELVPGQGRQDGRGR